MTASNVQHFPTLSQFGLLKIYTTLDWLSLAYKDDVKYFRYKAKGKRTFAVRHKFLDEFESHYRPSLWVLVIQIVSGMHAVLPIYRGRPDFFRINENNYADVASDAEIFAILEECNRRGGINIAEWNEFVAKQVTSP